MNKEHERSLDMERIDRFVELLFETLYELGLAPMNLGERPARFDKHPRELLAYLRIREREPNALTRVEAAFQEWQTWVLRKVPPELSFVKQRAFPRLAELYTFMRENADLFDRYTLAHLRKSMYGRAYAYLFPRLTQIFAFRDYCREEGLLNETVTETGQRQAEDGSIVEETRVWPRAVRDEAFVRRYFPDGTSAAWRESVGTYGEERAAEMQEAAITFLLDNPHYFNKVFADN